jgi:hypothetical protein
MPVVDAIVLAVVVVHCISTSLLLCFTSPQLVEAIVLDVVVHR